MPTASAALRTALDAQDVVTVAPTQTITVRLTFDGVAYDPVALYDALNAAYGTVSSDLDSPRGIRDPHFRIAA